MKFHLDIFRTVVAVSYAMVLCVEGDRPGLH